jgi:hypothetical protein
VTRGIINRATLSALAAVGVIAIASTAAAQSVGGCGYSVQTGTYGTWPGGYRVWVKVSNVSGQVATDFSLLVDVGSTTIASGALADYSPADGGYQVDAPSWLQWQKILANGVQASGGWVPLTASFTMPSCAQITEAQLYFERQFGQSSPAPDLYLDAVSVRAHTPSANLLPNGDFEASAAGWHTWNGAVSTTTETNGPLAPSGAVAFLEVAALQTERPASASASKADAATGERGALRDAKVVIRNRNAAHALEVTIGQGLHTLEHRFELVRAKLGGELA